MAWRSQPRFVAVLLGGRTARSGELIAIAFKGQPNVGFFGAPTAGASTANRTFPLANGGMVALATSVVRDRNGVTCAGPVLPDTGAEGAVADAEAWLHRQCATTTSVR